MRKITFRGTLNNINGIKSDNFEVAIYYIDPNPLIKDLELVKTFTNSKNEFNAPYRYNQCSSFSDAKSIKIRVDIKFRSEKIFEEIFEPNFNKVIDFGDIDVEGPNIGLAGRIIDENGKPFKGLVVEALGSGEIESSIKDNFIVKIADKALPFPLTDDSELSHSTTDENGYFEILYSQSKYSQVPHEKPDIKVVIKDVLGAAELYRTEKFSAVSDTVKRLDDIKINRNWAEGWLVTLGSPRINRFTEDNKLHVLIDNQVELESVVKSINHSTSYIYISQMDFNVDFVAI